jgi:hypothetical protein
MENYTSTIDIANRTIGGLGIRNIENFWSNISWGPTAGINVLGFINIGGKSKISKY